MANHAIVAAEYARSFKVLLEIECVDWRRSSRLAACVVATPKPRVNFDRFKTSTREAVVLVVCVAAAIIALGSYLL